MGKTVIGTFDVRDKAEQAVAEMRKSGFNNDEISIVQKSGNTQEGLMQNTDNALQDPGMGNAGDMQGVGMNMNMGNVSDGATTGGVLGGLAGLAAGAGALVIPGIGPLVAAGPIAGTLSGAATGGIAGGLIDWGIPENRGQHYEGEVKKGKILAIVRTQDKNIDDAANIMRKYGANDVETH